MRKFHAVLIALVLSASPLIGTAQIVNDITPNSVSWTGKRIQFVDSIHGGLGITYFDSTANAFYFTDSAGTLTLPNGLSRPKFIMAEGRLFFYGTGSPTFGSSAFWEKADTGFIRYIVDAVQINVYDVGGSLLLTGYNLNAIGWFNAALFNLGTSTFSGFPQFPVLPGGYSIVSAANADGTITMAGSPASVLDDSIWVFNPATLQLNATDTLPGTFGDSGVYLLGFVGDYWYGQSGIDFIYDTQTGTDVFSVPLPAIVLLGEYAVRKNLYAIGTDTVGFSLVMVIDTTTGFYSPIWNKPVSVRATNKNFFWTAHDVYQITDTSVINGIAEVPYSAGVAYPNPTSGTVTITGNDHRDPITVYDVTGRRVASLVETSGTDRVDLSACAPGTYFATFGTTRISICLIK